MSDALQTPSQIGRYRVVRLLGRGAMGVVYQAHDPVIDRSVAIKLLRIDLLDGSDRTEFLSRFQREAQAAARCAHPNIVAVFDFAMHNGDPFLAMEYVEGVSLADRLRQQGKMPAEQAVQIMRQVLDALASAHAVGVVHRDVKPANMLLLPGDRVKMTDFGIARLESSELTQHGVVVGTPSYMSPEQCRGDTVDARSDLFSAGAVFYELLTGERAFGRGNASQVIYRLMNEVPPAIATDHPAIPRGLAIVLRRALAKTPQERFASAAAMAAALGAATADEATVIHAPLASTATRIAMAEALRAEQALAEFLGPIARLLVKRTMAQANSPTELWDRLAEQIDAKADRAAFLRKR